LRPFLTACEISTHEGWGSQIEQLRTEKSP
jgi:hypothetical protein